MKSELLSQSEKKQLITEITEEVSKRLLSQLNEVLPKANNGHQEEPEPEEDIREPLPEDRYDIVGALKFISDEKYIDQHTRLFPDMIMDIVDLDYIASLLPDDEHNPYSKLSKKIKNLLVSWRGEGIKERTNILGVSNRAMNDELQDRTTADLRLR